MLKSCFSRKKQKGWRSAEKGVEEDTRGRTGFPASGKTTRRRVSGSGTPVQVLEEGGMKGDGATRPRCAWQMEECPKDLRIKVFRLGRAGLHCLPGHLPSRSSADPFTLSPRSSADIANPSRTLPAKSSAAPVPHISSGDPTQIRSTLPHISSGDPTQIPSTLSHRTFRDLPTLPCFPDPGTSLRDPVEPHQTAFI
uniref:Uncharacterized protein n=1 Tax=Chromera velia CCMP2878 TaxID=1169474 RepID=A0A0G4IG37_9ALVE|eukprot:Cvel_14138.t1-p1 / transcript=Cvel_14138.t1 / gene=Cvel_14138 / organism=Chromera_velia_CCMP2878 / gene_product=hypothetical protein / transcript_product=hypothetical protein / location=Cvel_scaffold996:31309-32884(+) / protein_length=195 / sequence_SO=supercontig / SO=protein_coding / is_pseudo=false